MIAFPSTGPAARQSAARRGVIAPAARALLACICFGALVACERGPVPAHASAMAAVQATNASATTSVNGLDIRIEVVQASQLNAAMAHAYRIARTPDTALLLVALRGPQASASDIVVDARVGDLSGDWHALPLREIRTPDPDDAAAPLIDRIGTWRTTLPNTLRFDVRVRHAGGVADLQLSRDFVPD